MKGWVDGRTRPSDDAEGKEQFVQPVLVVEQGPGVWGAQRYLLRLEPFYRTAGYALVLAAPRERELAYLWRRQGGRAVHFPVVSGRTIRGTDGHVSLRFVLREVFRTLWRSVRLARLARSVGARAIHANSHWTHLECALAGVWSRRPVVLHLHEEPLDDIGAYLRDIAIVLATRTIAVSERVASRVPSRLRNRRVVVIRNGVDVEQFRPGEPNLATRSELCARAENPLVVVMCRTDPRKGVDHAIEAIAKIEPPHDNVQLVVVGSGVLDEAWQEALFRLGADRLGGRVRFVGRRDDVREVLRAADVYVLASWHEGLPLGILEAQACGVPVVAYATAGVPEIVSHERTGLLVPERDIDALSKAIERLVVDGALRTSLCANARAFVEEFCTLDAQARAHVALMNEIIVANCATSSRRDEAPEVP